MSAQPRALELASGLRTGTLLLSEVDEAAEHLERMHAENEAQRTLLQEAVEAWDSDEIDTDPVSAVIEAIRQHLKGATK